MRELREIGRLCAYELRLRASSPRVWLGYLAGIVIILKQSVNYLAYADSLGEPVNVLEPFLMAGNSYNTSMFLVLGWLLIVSEAPFVDGNSMYLIHRTKRKNWSRAMTLYIALQAVTYYSVLMIATILFSSKNGFLANVWSRPLAMLTEGKGNADAFDVSFPYSSLLQENTMFGGFFQTLLLLFAYGLLMGLLLYAFSMVSNQLTGVIAIFAFHFLNYEIMKEGLGMSVKYSLLARSILVLQVGYGADVHVLGTYLLYAALLVLLFILPNILVKYIDFKEAGKGEVE